MSARENKYFEIFKSVPIIIAITDFKTGVFVEVNDAFYDLLGYKENEIIGALSCDIDLFLDVELFRTAQKELREKGAFHNHKLFVKDRQGVIHTGIFTGKVHSENGEKYIVTTMSDVTSYTEKANLDITKKQLKEQEKVLEAKNKSLKKSENRNEAILNVIPDTLFLYDVEGNFLDCQTNESTNLLQPKTFFVGKNMKDIMPPEISEKALACIQSAVLNETIESFEYELMIGDENKYFETRMVKSSSKEVLAIVREITSRKKEEELILELSYKDHLTNVYNRRYFDKMIEELDEEIYLPTSMFMLDMNGLKLTNDAFGHLKGDELLKIVASIIQDKCPEEASICRIGGDEFAIIIPNFGHEDSHELINSIYQEIDEIKVGEIVLSVSIGFETRNQMDITLRDVFIEAENHMVRRKLVESQSMRHQTVIAILDTLSEKNSREKKHSDQVSKLAKQIGKELGYKQHELKEIEMTGLLHDIGKIAVREEILNKPGKLTNEEYEEIKKHSESGYHILKTVDEYSSLADAILAHHERVDGKGYPKGLKGDEISETSKIIAVADTYEAMVSDRSYRSGTTHEKAIEEIERCAGTQFDTRIVKAFIDSFQRKMPAT